MNIETKFSIGDEIWVCVLIYENKKCPACSTCHEVAEHWEIVQVCVEEITVKVMHSHIHITYKGYKLPLPLDKRKFRIVYNFVEKHGFVHKKDALECLPTLK